MEGIRLIDPELYEAFLRGTLSVNGPLTGGAVVTGSLLLNEAELRVPSSGFASFAALIEVSHINEPADVRATRVRAGLLDTGNGGNGATSVRPIGLDITVSAPARIFVRGRGIDAELGGQIRLLGTTEQIVPSGAFNLIRGRLDILGKRLLLSTADLQLQGRFVPTLLISAQNENAGVISIVTIEGPADNPSVRFSSIPELPQEEALAQLLFGRGLDSLSALQGAQLANAIAVLAGRGGEGLVSRLRQGFGLDDLDLKTSDNGETALTAGKYISDNAYTEIEIEQGGKSRISLNLDVRPGVTVRGRVNDDGETGIGIFVERDY
jgi:translocation and assembly module TamB